jgi:HAMP domain-containing protein
MNIVPDTLVDQVVIEWDGRPGTFLTRTQPLQTADGAAARILRAFPMIGAWDDAFLMAECAAARMSCGMDMREFSYAAQQPAVTIRDGGPDEITLSEAAFNRLLQRLFHAMIAAADQANLEIRRDERWIKFRRDVETLAAR